MNCSATTKGGLLCRAAAGIDGLCYFHGNPGQAQKLGRIGGWKNRRRMPVDIHIPEKLTVKDLGKITAQAIGYVASGDLEPRAAMAMADLIRLKLRIDEGLELEYRLSSLEDQLAEEQARALKAAEEDKIEQGKTIDSLPADGVIGDEDPQEAMARAGESETKAGGAGDEAHNPKKGKGSGHER